jgi:DNA sulfur modification protein DndB
MSELRDMFFQGLISGSALTKERKLRKKPFIFESIPLALLSEYQQNGWIEHKRFKTKVRVKKPKPVDVAFEDRVWCVLADMGFDYMNSDRFFKLPYSDDYSLTQQVDVVAVDEETILIVECKAAETVNKNRSFKESIEAISGKKEGILNALKNVFPGSKHKVKFIFTTSNYVLPKPDLERLAHFDIIHFEEDEMGYYEDLTTHLGPATKYQLLGNLFEGQKIPALNNKVPAIKGKLGPYTFYSFSIEPERLLKLGYVLHRHKANKELMPTYQRVIKKDRLRAIETFIKQGGFSLTLLSSA